MEKIRRQKYLSEKLSPPHWMHCSNFPDRINVEKTSEQCSQSLSFTESQRRCLIGYILECRVRWWTTIRWRWLGTLYIMWKTLHKRGIGKIVKENKKRIIVAQWWTIFQKWQFDYQTNSSDVHSIHNYIYFPARTHLKP